MTAQSYSIWAALFVPVCCKWANMLSHQPNARPCTASFRPTGHIQWAPRFFQDQYIWRNDEWRTKTLRPIENEWDLRKCVLHSCLKKTSLQEEELKKRPVSVCAAATTHCFIDPLCQCVPLFCQCVSLNTYWAFKKKILYKKGPKGLKLASLPSNNKHSSPPSPPRHCWLISFHCRLKQACWAWASLLLFRHAAKFKARQLKAILSHRDAASCKSQL